MFLFPKSLHLKERNQVIPKHINRCDKSFTGNPTGWCYWSGGGDILNCMFRESLEEEVTWHDIMIKLDINTKNSHPTQNEKQLF